MLFGAVRAGTSLTFEVTGRASAWLSTPSLGDLRQAVIDRLWPYMTVDSLTLQTGGTGIAERVGLDYDFFGTMTIRPKSDYGAADDLGAVIANAFHALTGTLPTVTLGAGSQGGGITRPSLSITGGLSAIAVTAVAVAAIVLLPRMR